MALFHGRTVSRYRREPPKARTREQFREVCVRQHGSVVRAWKVMDLNGDLRCKKSGDSPKKKWCFPGWT